LRILNIRLAFVVWCLLFSLVPFAPRVLHAEKEGEGRFSIDFDNVSISDALSQLSQVTGIKILTKSPLENKIITRSYVNKTVDQIIKDILRNVNHALIWEYSEKGVDSITISIFDRGSGRYNNETEAENEERDLTSSPSELNEKSRKDETDLEPESKSGSADQEEDSPPPQQNEDDKSQSSSRPEEKGGDE
jgi:type II secretory pathway component GspD/PulD (secretin)